MKLESRKLRTREEMGPYRKWQREQERQKSGSGSPDEPPRSEKPASGKKESNSDLPRSQFTTSNEADSGLQRESENDSVPAVSGVRSETTVTATVCNTTSDAFLKSSSLEGAEDTTTTLSSLPPEPSSSSTLTPPAEWTEGLACVFVDAHKPVPLPKQSLTAYHLVVPQEDEFLRWLPVSSEFRRMQHAGGLPTLIQMFRATLSAHIAKTARPDSEDQLRDEEAIEAERVGEEHRCEERERHADEQIAAMCPEAFERLVHAHLAEVKKQYPNVPREELRRVAEQRARRELGNEQYGDATP